MTEPQVPQRDVAAGDGDEAWLDGGGLSDPDARPGAEPGAGSPVWPLIAAAAGLVIGAVTLAAGVALQILGYLCVSLLLFTAVAWFRRSSVEHAARSGVVTSQGRNVAAALLLLAGFALALVHAWNIAIHFS
jgi:hypothetical protein